MALGRLFVLGVSISLQTLKKQRDEFTIIEGEFIITARLPSLALLRGLLRYSVPGRVQLY